MCDSRTGRPGPKKEQSPVQTTRLEVQGRILQERARGGLVLIVVLAFLAGVAAVWLLA